jgi:tRNA (adenine37-N6)-methyltransferase
MKIGILIAIFFIGIGWEQLIAQSDTINYVPIGYFYTNYTTETGAPRQGILIPESSGVIVLDSIYRDALNLLDWFEYIYIIYHFNQAGEWESYVDPPGSNHAHNFGLFTTRSPKRPNPIGLSLVKLEKISKDSIYISGVDAFNGTPVLDIKPYLPSVDMVKSLQNELVEKEFGHHDEDYIKDSIYYK